MRTGLWTGSDFGIWNSHKFQSSYDARMSDDRFARWLKREPTLETQRWFDSWYANGLEEEIDRIFEAWDLIM